MIIVKSFDFVFVALPSETTSELVRMNNTNDAQRKKSQQLFFVDIFESKKIHFHPGRLEKDIRKS